MKKILYTIFPSLMPKQWKTRNEDYIVYTYDEDDDVFIGQNNVVVGLGYVLKRMDVYKR
jgi:hypothetical protein